MKLDIRFPIGLLFSLFGVILTIYGIVSNKAIYERSLGMDVNLWWGLVLLGFGLAMLSFAVRANDSKWIVPPLPKGEGDRG